MNGSHLVTDLPDDILVKVDRASIALSLEVRRPLLDHRVAESVWHLPLGWKVDHGKGKWLPRNLLERHIPRRLFKRPKTTFDVPLASWLRGPLRDWAEGLLDEQRLHRDGIFNAESIQRCWQERLFGKQNG